MAALPGGQHEGQRHQQSQFSPIMWALGLTRALACTATSGWFTSRKDHRSVMVLFSATYLETTVANSRWPLSAKSTSLGPHWPARVTRPNGMIMCPNSRRSCLGSRGDGHCRRVPKLFQFSDACRFPPISLPKPWEVRFRFRMTFLSFFLSCIILGSLCFDQIWTQFWWRILWYCDGVYQNVNTRTTTRL